jgi:hypothetical protein
MWHAVAQVPAPALPLPELSLLGTGKQRPFSRTLPASPIRLEPRTSARRAIARLLNRGSQFGIWAPALSSSLPPRRPRGVSAPLPLSLPVAGLALGENGRPCLKSALEYVPTPHTAPAHQAAGRGRGPGLGLAAGELSYFFGD